MNGAERQVQALDRIELLIELLPGHAVVVRAQSLGELFNVLVLKAKRSRKVARTAVLTYLAARKAGNLDPVRALRNH